ncbi:MAG: DUF86 domain-containing protein [Alphaproteobacteria bacterium]|nr:DUF86 domain-containing protein [Alphaproteobacteria bacterium]
MKSVRVEDRLDHILEAVANLKRVTAGRRMADLETDVDFGALVERYIERISEASRHVPAEMKAKHPEIDWQGIAGIGNILRHAYHLVDPNRLWKIVSGRLDQLQAAAEALRAEIRTHGGA